MKFDDASSSSHPSHRAAAPICLIAIVTSPAALGTGGRYTQLIAGNRAASRGCVIVDRAVRPLDTTEKAATLAAELNRTLGPERRFLQAMELSDLLLQMAKAGLRSRLPECSEAEITRRLTLQLHSEVSRRK